MDLGTVHAAYTLHTQEAQHAEREREFRRVAKERAMAQQAETPARTERHHRKLFSLMIRGRVRSAQ
ncbi:MAG TPA: hypothetical protein VK537_08005 [Galbitalea sp.]|nr:hypothetical protein [Galbitalea sp.]